MLRCPNCHQNLFKANNSFKCVNNHSFDLAKEGYVNLLLPHMSSSQNAGDNKMMVNARSQFLNEGHYLPLADELISQVKDLKITSPIILDCGCGDGFFTSHLNHNLAALIYGFDISKNAVLKAAKRNKNITFFVGNASNIPVNDSLFDIILNIFAPSFENEFFRCLKNNGYIIKVIPNLKHLYELKAVLYSNPYLNDIKADNIKGFRLIKTSYLEYQSNLSKKSIENLFKMTPYYHKTSENDKQKLTLVTKLSITFSFIIMIYQKE